MAKFGEWQPIETAPKDGTKVDLWCQNKLTAKREVNCSWREGWGAWFREDSIGVFDVTHWMPLPPPPAQEGE